MKNKKAKQGLHLHPQHNMVKYDADREITNIYEYVQIV
jgi:hypothetical protein